MISAEQILHLQLSDLSLTSREHTLLTKEGGGVFFLAKMHDRLWFYAEHLPGRFPAFTTGFIEDELDVVLDMVRQDKAEWCVESQALVEDRLEFADFDLKVLAPGRQHSGLTASLAEALGVTEFWLEKAMIARGYARPCPKCGGQGYHLYVDDDTYREERDPCYRCEETGKVAAQYNQKILKEVRESVGWTQPEKDASSWDDHPDVFDTPY